ncbi:MAG: rhomboid family intramembrane serine protease, partial [Nanoarchaeota archaeon]
MARFKFYALWLCLICIIVFVIQILIPAFTDLILLNQDAISNFQIWRFLTAIFAHGGLVHLLYNIFALALFGSML